MPSCPRSCQQFTVWWKPTTTPQCRWLHLLPSSFLFQCQSVVVVVVSSLTIQGDAVIVCFVGLIKNKNKVFFSPQYDCKHYYLMLMRSWRICMMFCGQNGGECLRAFASVAIEQLVAFRDDFGKLSHIAERQLLCGSCFVSSLGIFHSFSPRSQGKRKWWWAFSAGGIYQDQRGTCSLQQCFGGPSEPYEGRGVAHLVKQH